MPATDCTVAHSGLPQRCQAARSRSAQDKPALKYRRSLRRRCLGGSLTADAETAAETAHASLLSVEHDPRQESATERVAPYDADRLLYVTRVPIRA
eukprot:2368007-Prymnesium_polylepis.1